MPLSPGIMEDRRSTWTIRKYKDQANHIGAEASRIAGEAIEAVAPLFPGASLDAMIGIRSAAIVLGVVRSDRSSGLDRLESGVVRSAGRGNTDCQLLEAGSCPGGNRDRRRRVALRRGCSTADRAWR